MSNIEIHRTREDAADAAVHDHATECTCGEVDEDLPEFDVQTIPHAIRHQAIFGAVEALKPGAGLIISANHNPLPLLAQLEARYEDRFSVSYLDQGPDRWRILIRNAA